MLGVELNTLAGLVLDGSRVEMVVKELFDTVSAKLDIDVQEEHVEYNCELMRVQIHLATIAFRH